MTKAAQTWQPVTLGEGFRPPAGAYSPAVRAGDLVFVSGQVPRDPATGELVGEDIEGQTKQVITNVQRALVAAGATLGDVVSMTVYLADVDHWTRFNAAYKELMPSPHPTRTVVGANLRGILIEVSAIAHKPS